MDNNAARMDKDLRDCFNMWSAPRVLMRAKKTTCFGHLGNERCRINENAPFE
ncbi:hypothetical protein BMETH_62_3 [methanotrophic bacterial endosymbiont of Bathymodiolus sp.]|nr:hypothetical protein BMETH_62_3 [methanotrophic bacterial endosymbiont of Bathymodiolus sp.]